jgi:hypothetical protein
MISRKTDSWIARPRSGLDRDVVYYRTALELSDDMYDMFRTWFINVYTRAMDGMEPGRQAEICRAQWAAWRKYVDLITRDNFKIGTGCYDTIIKQNIHVANKLVTSSEDFMFYYDKRNRSFSIQGLGNLTKIFEKKVEKLLRNNFVNGAPAIDAFSLIPEPKDQNVHVSQITNAIVDSLYR